MSESGAKAFVEVLPDFTHFGEKLGAGVEGPLASLEGKMHQLVSLLPGGPITAGVVGGAVAIGTAFVAIGEKFQGAFNQIRSETGAVGPTFDALKQNFKDILASGPESMKQVADAMDLVFQRTHLTGGQLDTFTETELRLARITGQDVKSQVDTTTQALANFGVQGAGPSTAALEALLAVSQKTGISVDDLASQVVGKAGATFRAFGLDVGSSADLLGSLEAAGIPASTAVMGLQKALVEAQKTGVDAKTELKDLFQNLQTGTDGTKATAEAIKVFGARSYESLRDAVKSGKLTLADFSTSFAGVKGSIDRTAEANETLGQTFDRMKNVALVALEPIASKSLKGLEEGIKGVQHFLGPLIDAFKFGFSGGESGTEGVGGLAETFSRLGASVAKELPKIEAFAKEVLPQIQAALVKIGPPLEKFAGFLIRDVFPIVVKLGEYMGKQFVVIFRVVADAVKFLSDLFSGDFSKALGDLGDLVGNVGSYLENLGSLILSAVGPAFVAVGSAILDALGKIPGLIVGALEALGSAILNELGKIPGLAGGALEALGGVILKALEGLPDLLLNAGKLALKGLEYGIAAGLLLIYAQVVLIPQKIIELLGDLAGLLVQGGTDLLTGLWNGAQAALPIIVNFYTSLPGNIVKWLGDLLGLLLQGGKDVLTGMWNGLQAGVSAVSDFVTALPANIINWVGDVGSLLLDVGGKIIHSAWVGLTVGVPALALFFVGLPGQILGWIGDLGSVLFNAGEKLIEGLVNGIGSAFHTVKKKFDELTNLIPSWKGPPATDATLLFGNGQLIMQGLLGGITDQMPALKDTLAAVTSSVTLPTIPGTVAGRSGLGPSLVNPGGGGPLVGEMHFHVPAGVDPQPYADSVIPVVAGAFNELLVVLQRGRV